MNILKNFISMHKIEIDKININKLYHEPIKKIKKLNVMLININK